MDVEKVAVKSFLEGKKRRGNGSKERKSKQQYAAAWHQQSS